MQGLTDNAQNTNKETERMRSDKPESWTARQIANALFVNSKGERAVRLQLKIRDWSDGLRCERGSDGWSYEAMVEKITEILEGDEE